ncbi:30S ribosomal protein S18 [Candidatus Woesebacteria bacterium RIFOXYB1_FULL_38_16]|uniref:Small ribosomal subunit protein bS18 n=1 Tax=Candidatus Woesebacteria bacterium RIFOXYB1_FULL_38_16 TaxID=1802538 RepID=A0A1F8CR74_9BACT|nr:MAG: 30S ribosomal protein S18 [Candidatus Woesebacteria bacterium RIFOXYA1_FULL_38_9]OGM78761.1 MAG: 30S ribosomal protein S18 [Candidatus Woesebacteria bacterium RIFOXYB1_FULL_38_16]
MKKTHEKRRVVKSTPKPRKHIDFSFKNYEILNRFISDRAKIPSRRRSGLTAKQQRKLSTAIKQARFLGLLPFKAKI